MLIPLQVLDRTVLFMMRSLPTRSKQQLRVVQNVVIAVVVTGNALGLAAHLAAGYYMSHVVALHYQMADAVESNRLSEVGSLGKSSAANYDVAAVGMAIQVCCEVVVLIVIITSFCAVLPTCIQVLHNAKKSAKQLGDRAKKEADPKDSAAIAAILEEVDSEGRSLKRRLIFTVIAVFVTFLLRAAFAAISAFGESVCCFKCLLLLNSDLKIDIKLNSSLSLSPTSMTYFCYFKMFNSASSYL
jgi:hypothetical protein